METIGTVKDHTITLDELRNKLRMMPSPSERPSFPKLLLTQKELRFTYWKNAGEFNVYSQPFDFYVENRSFGHMILGHLWIGEMELLWGSQRPNYFSELSNKRYIAVRCGKHMISINQMCETNQARDCDVCFLNHAELMSLVEYLTHKNWTFGDSVLLDNEHFQEINKSVDNRINILN
jgi:hypothetical protein